MAGRTWSINIRPDAECREPMLNLNDRLHWRVKARRTDAWRNLGAWYAAAAGVPRLDRAAITVEFSWPDHRKRDVTNWSATVKALVDGIVSDAGVLPDDDDEHLTVTIRRAPRTAETLISIYVEEIA